MSRIGTTQIRHPDWLLYSKPQQSITLYNDGRLPRNIAGWMIVTGLKHPLRAVYGSDLRAALALLWQAIAAPFEHWWLRIRYRDEDDDEPRP